MLSIASICAVVAVIFLTSAVVAHGCSYGDSCSNGGYGYGGGYGDGGYSGGCGSCSQTYSYSSYQYPPSQPIISPLTATCYASPISTYVGNTVTWYASVTGGSGGAYNISWTGTDGLSGIGSSIMKVYNTSGSKNASVTIISGSQSVAVNCGGTVQVWNPNLNQISNQYQYPTDNGNGYSGGQNNNYGNNYNSGYSYSNNSGYNYNGNPGYTYGNSGYNGGQNYGYNNYGNNYGGYNNSYNGGSNNYGNNYGYHYNSTPNYSYSNYSYGAPVYSYGYGNRR